MISKSSKHSILSMYNQVQLPAPEQKPIRHVSFADVTLIEEVVPCSTMTYTERDKIWYTSYEIDEFRESVRYLCRKLLSPEGTSCCDCKAPPCIRGFEQRLSCERIIYKAASSKAIIKAQNAFNRKAEESPNSLDRTIRLANFARNCTRWATVFALSAGRDDFVEAYPHMSIHVPPVLISSSIFPPLIKRKRGADENTIIRTKRRLLSAQSA
mmetsp:Transcript_13929/g.25211  ORF Transcript_13929/g.25211 Transcript_13929/m.25211 type:complete len:212 (-) Transcript_13929:129-764(-)